MRGDGQFEVGLLEKFLQVGGNVEGGRLKVLRNEALQDCRVGREDGQGKDPPRGGDEAGGKGLEINRKVILKKRSDIL